MVQKMGGTKKVINVGEISGIYDILTAEEKQVARIGNRTKRILEMNPWQR